MAGGSIGNLSLKLSTNAEALVTGLEAAKRKVNTFVGTSIVSLKRLTNIPGAIEDVFNQTFGSILQSDSMFSKIDASAKMADRLGLATEALEGFNHAANLSGVDSALLGRAFIKLQRNLAGVITKGEAVGKSFESFGLNAKDLLGMNMEDRILTLADAYSKLGTDVERTAFASTVIGPLTGPGIMKFLENGRAGLEAARKEAEQLGLTFSRFDATGVEMARDAVTRLESVFTGIKKQLAVQIAPLIGVVAEKLVEWVKSGPSIVDIFKSVGQGLRTVMAGVAAAMFKVAEVVGKIIAEVSKLAAKFGDLNENTKKVKETTQGWGEWLGNKTGLSSVGPAIAGVLPDWLGIQATQTGKKPGTFGGGAGDAGPAAPPLSPIEAWIQEAKKGMDAFWGNWDKRQKEATDAIEAVRLSPVFGSAAVSDAENLIASLQKQLSGMDGLSQTEQTMQDIALTIAELKQKNEDSWFGLNKGTIDNIAKLEGQLQGIKILDAELQRVKFLEGLKTEAEQLTESLKTPFDTFEEKTARMRELLKEGFIDWATFRRGVTQAGDALDKATGRGAIASPQALQRGSAAAFTAVNQATRRAAEGPNDAVVKVLQEAKKEQKERDNEQLRVLREIAENFGLGDLLPA